MTNKKEKNRIIPESRLTVISSLDIYDMRSEQFKALPKVFPDGWYGKGDDVTFNVCHKDINLTFILHPDDLNKKYR